MRAAALELWLDASLDIFRVIDADARIYRAWARLAPSGAQDRGGDTLIAATALVHGLTIATRNLKDFAAFPVPTFDPFTYPR